MGVKPEIASHLAQRAISGIPEVWQAPLDEIRKNTLSHIALKQPLVEINRVDHQNILVQGVEIPIRIYRPSSEPKLPALIFFHGGGWVLNFLDIYEPSLRKISKNGQFIVIAVQYRKAPEFPYPVPFNDCYAALKWTIDNASALGIDLESIGVGGDSAGGNLASAVAIKCRDEKLINLAFQLLIYPCNDLAMDYKSAADFAEGYGLSTKSMRWFWEQYLPDKKDHKDPYAVPAAAKELRGVAPAIIYTAEFDPIVDDGRNYHRQLQKDGVPTIYKEYAGQIHGFFNLSGVTADAELLYLDIANEINAILGRGN